MEGKLPLGFLDEEGDSRREVMNLFHMIKKAHFSPLLFTLSKLNQEELKDYEIFTMKETEKFLSERKETMKRIEEEVKKSEKIVSRKITMFLIKVFYDFNNYGLLYIFWKKRSLDLPPFENNFGDIYSFIKEEFDKLERIDIEESIFSIDFFFMIDKEKREEIFEKTINKKIDLKDNSQLFWYRSFYLMSMEDFWKIRRNLIEDIKKYKDYENLINKEAFENAFHLLKILGCPKDISDLCEGILKKKNFSEFKQSKVGKKKSKKKIEKGLVLDDREREEIIKEECKKILGNLMEKRHFGLKFHSEDLREITETSSYRVENYLRGDEFLVDMIDEFAKGYLEISLEDFIENDLPQIYPDLEIDIEKIDLFEIIKSYEEVIVNIEKDKKKAAEVVKEFVYKEMRKEFRNIIEDRDVELKIEDEEIDRLILENRITHSNISTNKILKLLKIPTKRVKRIEKEMDESPDEET